MVCRVNERGGWELDGWRQCVSKDEPAGWGWQGQTVGVWLPFHWIALLGRSVMSDSLQPHGL